MADPIVPSWVDAHLPPAGPCGFCGGPDSRHRVLDAIASRLSAGESVESCAEDYGYPPAFIERIGAEWRPTVPDDLLDEAERIRTRSGRTAEVVGLLVNRLAKVESANADLELDNEGLSRHVALMERHRMGEARLAAAARRVLKGLDGYAACRYCGGWVNSAAGHKDDCALEALRRLVESPVDPQERR